jgi:DNA-binding transcriptional MerR regulator
MNVSSEPIGHPHLIRVGDLARQTGKTVRAIHLYEEQGLLAPATRSSGGFRLYEASAVERVRWIDLLHGLGFSLHEMRELIAGWWGSGLGPEAMASLRSLFVRKLEETRETIVRHQQLERELTEGLRYLETCRVCATPAAVTGCASCQQDHGMSAEPALVAGIITPPGIARRGRGAAFVPVGEIRGVSRARAIAGLKGKEERG